MRRLAALARALADVLDPPKVPAGRPARRWPEAEDLPRRRGRARRGRRKDRLGELPEDPPDDGGGAGVREPRRPRPPGPVSAAGAKPPPEPRRQVRLPDARR